MSDGAINKSYIQLGIYPGYFVQKPVGPVTMATPALILGVISNHLRFAPFAGGPHVQQLIIRGIE